MILCKKCNYYVADNVANTDACKICNQLSDSNIPGIKLDYYKHKPRLVIEGFSHALEAVSKVGSYGATKYTEHGWKQVPEGEKRYTDAMYRHLLKHAQGKELDDESNLPHLAHAAWNILARLELLLGTK